MALHTVRWQLHRRVRLSAVRESFNRRGLDFHADPPVVGALPRHAVDAQGDDPELLTRRRRQRVDRRDELVDRADEARALINNTFPAPRCSRSGGERPTSCDRPGRRRRRTSAALDPNDPEVREVMEAHMAMMEEYWLDQEIPALGGRTHARPCRIRSAGKKCAGCWQDSPVRRPRCRS